MSPARRGLARKDQKAVVSHVKREIDENIHTVGTDQLSRLWSSIGRIFTHASHWRFSLFVSYPARRHSHNRRFENAV